MNRLVLALAVSLALSIGCSNDVRPPAQERPATLEDRSQAALAEMLSKDPDLQALLDGACAYAIFPEVGKSGPSAGGAPGRGIVHERGSPVGLAEIQHAATSAPAGAHAFAELLVFKDRDTFRRFTGNQLSMSAGADAVLLKAGVSRGIRFEGGLAVITMPHGGSMLRPSIGGQRFVFTPAGEARVIATRPAARQQTPSQFDAPTNAP